MIVTIMALVFGSKSSTGIIVPLLIVGDIFAVIYYNRHARWDYLFKLLPWMIAGVLIGVWIGKDLPELLENGIEAMKSEAKNSIKSGTSAKSAAVLAESTAAEVKKSTVQTPAASLSLNTA